MDVRSPTPPASDGAIGLEFYATSTPGVGGTLKTGAEDFRVREVSAYPLPREDGAYTILRVESRNWEQHELAEAIARRLSLPRNSIEWAGTKDRRAVTERLLSYRGPPPDRDLGLPNVVLQDAYRAADGVRLGHLYGNSFDIRVRELSTDPGTALTRFRATHEALRSIGGFPNFFGPQRFGEVRPITHAVGRALVRGDAAEAVEIYLAAVPPGDAPAPARLAYAQDHDVARALREFPSEYRFERSILERLARGQPPERALKGLQRELRMLFVHAFQSLLFNRWISERHRADVRLDEVVEGDRILRLGRDGTVRGTDEIPVEPDNRSECAALVERGRAVVAGPLVGYDTTVPAGPAGAFLTKVLAGEEVRPEAFRLPAFPELASRGTWRPAMLPLPPIAIAAEAEEGASVRFRFALPKGSYATILLREFLKPGGTEIGESTRAF